MRLDNLSKGVWGLALPNVEEKMYGAGIGGSGTSTKSASSSSTNKAAQGYPSSTAGYNPNAHTPTINVNGTKYNLDDNYSGTEYTGSGVNGSGNNEPEAPEIPPTGSGGYYYGGGSSTSSTPTQPTESDDTALNNLLNTDAAAAKTKSIMANIPDASIGRINNVDTAEEEAILNQIKAAQEQQSINTIDYGTDTSIKELQRAEQDAQETYDTQRNQIAKDAQRALDNQVLYSQARGDNGGIGLSQYNSIQNTAAVNELTVNNEQTKLATETERQIQDLRAQGEYTKADQLLSISQNYLSQLMSLKQWAKETNVSIDEFNAQLAEWEANYKLSLVDAELSVANATGAFGDGTSTFSAWTAAQNQLANVGNALISAGIIPSSQQLEAMGYTSDQATAYINYMKSKGKI